jgi:hypothetical protein
MSLNPYAAERLVLGTRTWRASGGILFSRRCDAGVLTVSAEHEGNVPRISAYPSAGAVFG